jgi:hypothetical protein
MAYTYLDVTNEVLARFNEVELSLANFNNARGFQIQSKNAINAAIRHINQKAYSWPFNHAEAEVTLVANQTRYDLPASTKLVDYQTFRLKHDTTLGNSGRSLIFLDYKEYVDKYIEQEDKTGVGAIPTHVFRDPANKYGLYPYPDKAYVLKFDYYTFPTSLVNATDVPSIPERFRHVIVDGAVMYGFQYRGETQQYQLNLDRFEEGIKNMESLLSNRHDYVRSTYIPRTNRFSIVTGTVT